jgi:hypothetical protein
MLLATRKHFVTALWRAPVETASRGELSGPVVPSSMLLLEKYAGDLRKLRQTAGRDPARERELLKEW